MMKHFLILIFLVLVLFSCLESDEDLRPLRDNNVTRLLTGDSAKVWELVSRTINNGNQSLRECETDNVILLQSVADSVLLTAFEDEIICEEAILDTLVFDDFAIVFSGRGGLIPTLNNSIFQDTLTFRRSVDDIIVDSTIFEVNLLTSENLIWSFEETDTITNDAIIIQEEYVAVIN